MSPQYSETDRFHGIDANYPSRLIKKALSEGRLTLQLILILRKV